MITISIYPDEEFKKQLEEFAAKENRSLNKQVLKILKDYFKSYSQEKRGKELDKA